MSDTVDPAKRSWIMSRIRGKDTKIEVALRHYLFRAGFRYRKNDRRYPGTPDVVLPRFRTVIFVNGCFWHGHEGCKKYRIPKTRTDYWTQKIERNRRNDKANISKLEALGWSVIVVWECEVESDFEKTMVSVVERLHQNLRALQEALAAKKALAAGKAGAAAEAEPPYEPSKGQEDGRGGRT